MHLPLPQIAWLLGTLSVWIVALYAFSRHRRQTSDYANWREFKRRLPSWVQRIESYTILAVWAGLLVLFGATVSHFHLPLKEDASGILIFSAFFFASLAPAMLAGNFLSWIFPPLLKANLEAMDGLPGLSLKKANIELLQFGGIALAMALGQCAVALLKPWTL